MGGGQQRVINREGPPRTPTYEKIHTYAPTYTHAQSSFPTVACGSADALTINILLVLMMLLLLVCQRVSSGCLELKRPQENTAGVEQLLPATLSPDSLYLTQSKRILIESLFLRNTCRLRTCTRPPEQAAHVKRTFPLLPDHLVW